MHCVQNRIYCHDCNKSFTDSNYPNLLRSQGHIVNVMKKRCCGCNSAINQNKLCNIHDLECCISKLTIISDDNTQIDFSDEQNHTRKITFDNSVRYFPKSEQKEKY